MITYDIQYFSDLNLYIYLGIQYVSSNNISINPITLIKNN